MKNYSSLILMFLIALLGGCEKKENSYDKRFSTQVVDFNPLVEGYTEGMVGRAATVNVLFSVNIPDKHQSPEFLEKVFSITPKVKGTLSVRNRRELIFKPNSLLNRNENYTVSIDLKKLFDTEEKSNRFSFSFWTIPPEINMKITNLNLDITELGDTIYNIVCHAKTSDIEDSLVIRNLFEFSEPVIVNWDKQRRSNDFRLTVQPEKQYAKGGKIDVFIKDNPEGYRKKKIATLKVPAKNDFSVYQIEPVTGNDEYVNVIFTRSLDPDQDLSGLIEVSPNDNTTMSIAGNRLKIWIADKNRSDHIVRVHDGIRSTANRVLKKSEVNNPNDFVKEVSFQSKNPSLGFIGNGSVIPIEGNAIVPFYATSLRGVIVRIIKIYENNMGEFLQINNLNGDNQLPRVGVLLCRKIIFLDEMSHYDLSDRNAFALDLKSLITPEPGAMYRVILSFNQDLSAFPCENNRHMSKKELLEQNAIIEKNEMEQFGNGNSYYYFNDQGWENYNWDERNMPCKSSYYVNRQVGKNILYSDLGIIAKNGDAGNMLVSVHNLSTARPEKDVSVSVYDFQNQLIERKTTWDDGTVEINVLNKKPYYLIAKNKEHTGYLRLDPSQSLSMSTFDVAGEEVRKGIKGFIYTDRGVWRPGDSIYVTFILNDRDKALPPNHPVTLELFTPDNQLYKKISYRRSLNNFYYFPIKTPENGKTGIWNCQISVGGVSFYKKLRIETIKPNRLEIDLEFDQKILERNQEFQGNLSSRWLTGAMANQLKYDVTATFIPTKTQFDGYKGYIFDNPTAKYETEDILISKGITNEQGKASFNKTLRLGATAPGMLQGQFVSKVYEESGEFSVSAIQKNYSPYTSYAGIRTPQNSKNALSLNTDHIFNIATVTPDGKALAHSDLEIKIYKVDWYWWWSSDFSGIANYLTSRYENLIRKLNMVTNKNGLGQFVLSFRDEDWGTYYIQVKDKKSGHLTGCMAYFDDEYRTMNGVTDKAVLLSITTDKEEYVPGEKIQISFPSAEKSRALVCVENSGGILQHQEVNCQKGETRLTIEASKDMEPNVYISVSLINPYATTESDLPIRMYGVVPIRVCGADSHLEPIIKSPESVKPNSRFNVTISEKKGLPMTYTIAVVDDGLLDLTRFKTPSPWNAFFAKEALSVRTWDMYNFVLGAYGGKIEQMFSIGGDDALNKGPKAIMNRFEPVVIYKGPYELKKGESKTIPIDMPNYIGRVRCMVVAGNENGYGNAEKNIFVRQPVMILGTLPRLLAPGDEIWVPATVFAMEDNIGDIAVELSSSPDFDVIGNNRQTVSMQKTGNKLIWFKIKTKETTGAGQISLTARAKNNTSLWCTDIEIKSPLTSVMKIQNYTVEKGETADISFQSFGLNGSQSAQLEVSGVKPLNLSKRLGYLLDYPYSCLEQLISKAFPYLYLADVAEFSTQEHQRMKETVNDVLGRLPSYLVGGTGGVSYWPGGTNVNGWGTAYAANFLIEATKRGYPIQPRLMKRVTEYIGNIARNWNSVESPYQNSEQSTQAYRLYVLAKAGMTESGAMNRLRTLPNLNPNAKWILALAYAEVGRDDISKQLIESAGNDTNRTDGWDYTFGSPLREMGYHLLLFTKLKMNRNASALAGTIQEILASQNWYDTYATSTALIAMARYYEWMPPVKEMSFTLADGSKNDAISCNKAFWSGPVNFKNGNAQLKLKNNSSGTLFIRSIVSGIPTTGEQFATENGMALNITYTNANGAPIEIGSLPQGTNFFMNAEVINTQGTPIKDLMLDQQIPSGWEILNTGYMFGNESSGTKNPGITYQNILDTKVISYIPRMEAFQRITVRVPVVASFAGKYFLPATTCEAMYDGNINASSKGVMIEVVRNE